MSVRVLVTLAIDREDAARVTEWVERVLNENPVMSPSVLYVEDVTADYGETD